MVGIGLKEFFDDLGPPEQHLKESKRMMPR